MALEDQLEGAFANRQGSPMQSQQLGASTLVTKSPEQHLIENPGLTRQESLLMAGDSMLMARQDSAARLMAQPQGASASFEALPAGVHPSRLPGILSKQLTEAEIDLVEAENMLANVMDEKADVADQLDWYKAKYRYSNVVVCHSLEVDPPLFFGSTPA